MRDSGRYEDEPLEKRLQTPLDCSREGFDYIEDQRTYCKFPDKECLYLDDKKDRKRRYRCMRLEKQV